MTNTGLVVRVWNDAAIARRDEDGYANATAMCAANGREWSGYIRTDRTKDYIQALAASLDLTPADLVITTTTGPNEFRGTWVHPRLAVDLARWISPEFAVWMDGWFLNATQGHQPAPQPQVSRQEFDQLTAQVRIASNGVMALAYHLEQRGVDVDMPSWQQPSLFLHRNRRPKPTPSAWPCSADDHAHAAMRLISAATSRGITSISPRDVLTWRIFGRRRITAPEALQFLREAASRYRLGVMVPGRRRRQYRLQIEN